MQTGRHRIFAALALCTTACCPRPSTQAVPSTVPGPAEAPPPAAATPASPSPAQPRPLASTSGPAPGAPTIAHARFASPRIVSVHFSEPVTIPADLDPRQFRLSIGSHESESDGYRTTYYYDPTAIDEPHRPATFSGIRIVDDVTLELLLSEALPRDICDDALAPEPGIVMVETGIFLHYRDAADAGIEDSDGQRLADIAPQWILRNATMAAYSGPTLPPIAALGPIPCTK